MFHVGRECAACHPTDVLQTVPCLTSETTLIVTSYTKQYTTAVKQCAIMQVFLILKAFYATFSFNRRRKKNTNWMLSKPILHFEKNPKI